MFYDALSGVPGLPCDHKLTNSLTVQPFQTHAAILFFTCSTESEKLHEVFNTLL